MGGFHLFTLARVPVSVSPWYLLLLVMLSYPNPGRGMVLAFCITVSLLAHEFGHALMARHFKLQPQILLHGLGGLTGHDRAKRDRDEALIIAAGPFAGLMLGVVALLVTWFAPPQSMMAASVLQTFVFINFVWSIFNLLPMWPMDGGQLLRIGASKVLKPARGERFTHIASIVTVVAVGIASNVFGYGSMMLMLILGLTAFQNVQALQASGPASAPRRDNPYARELIEHAEHAYAQGDDESAARLGHQLRAESNVPPHILGRAWAILGVTATRKGDFDEALSYLRRAPSTPDVVEAMAQCLYQLDMFDELEELAASRAFRHLPDDVREEIMRALQERSAESA